MAVGEFLRPQQEWVDQTVGKHTLLPEEVTRVVAAPNIKLLGSRVYYIFDDGEFALFFKKPALSLLQFHKYLQSLNLRW